MIKSIWSIPIGETGIGYRYEAESLSAIKHTYFRKSKKTIMWKRKYYNVEPCYYNTYHKYTKFQNDESVVLNIVKDKIKERLIELDTRLEEINKKESE